MIKKHSSYLLKVAKLYMCTMQRYNYTSTTTGDSTGKVKVTFQGNTGRKRQDVVIWVDDTQNMSLMEVAVKNKLDVEAACDGTCACSTCIMDLDEASYQLYDAPGEDELDLLDMAPSNGPTSRLSCQLKVNSQVCSNITATIPNDTTSLL